MDYRFSWIQDFILAFKFGLPGLLKALRANPTILFRPRALSRAFFASVWIPFGEGVDKNTKEIKEKLITPHAYGTVLELGAGHGHSVKYMNRSLIKRYIALEPNAEMHAHIIQNSTAAGYDPARGELIILSCGAEDVGQIRRALEAVEVGLQVDTLLSVLTLCSIPNGEDCVMSLTKEVLAPGGQWLFYEHVSSPIPQVRWWQWFWTPIWRIAFDGCSLDRPSHEWIAKVGGWSEKEVWGKEGQSEYTLFWHQGGRYARAR